MGYCCFTHRLGNKGFLLPHVRWARTANLGIRFNITIHIINLLSFINDMTMRPKSKHHQYNHQYKSNLVMDPSTLAKISPSISFDELPKVRYWNGKEFYQWEGFWYRLPHLKGVIAARSHFEVHDDDVLLASSLKTGTTWLKALIPCIMNLKVCATGDRNNNNDNNDNDDDDPLVKNHPNPLMPSLELQIFHEQPNPDLSGMPSPRLYRTHVPYTMLSDSIKDSSCKIVYITRDPKDSFVSLWYFINSNYATPEREPYPINEAFEIFCQGVHPFGLSMIMF